MKRPAGVILTSIVLGLCAGLQLLFAAITGFAGIAMGHMPADAMPSAAAYPPGAVPPAPGLMVGMMVAYAIFLVLLAVWAIVTLAGLLRLRNWARYSVLVIGACMTGLGVMSIFGSLVAMAMMGSMPLPPNAPPHMMQMVFAFYAVIFAVVAAIGMWWLVYFNLRRTKTFFISAYPVGYEPAHAIGYGIDPEIFPALPRDAPVYPPPAEYPAPGRLYHVPTPVIVLGCLFIVGGIASLGCLFLPYPVFLAGFVLSPVASHAVCSFLGLFTIAMGAGLIRLQNAARIAMYGLTGLGAVNAMVFLTPWCRARLLAYQAQLYERMHLPVTPLTTSMISGPMMIYSVFMWLAVYGVFVWILHHYRGAFKR